MSEDFDTKPVRDHTSAAEDAYLTFLFWACCIGFGTLMGWFLGAIA